MVFFILSPSFSFESGIDVRFHFSSIYTLILAGLFLPALMGLSWLLDSFAAMRIDVEREAEQLAAIEAFKSDPGMEALHRLNPAAKAQAER
jgi:hypothetical protein